MDNINPILNAMGFNHCNEQVVATGVAIDNTGRICDAYQVIEIEGGAYFLGTTNGYAFGNSKAIQDSELTNKFKL